jgi:hypothetical protein
MVKALKLSVAASAALMCVMTAGLASAQEAGGTASASGQAGMALPGAAPQAAATTGDSDHDQVVGRLAVGYMGRVGVPVATGFNAGPPATVATTNIDAPTIGVRYWIDQMIGLDVGLGMGMAGGSVTTDPGGNSVDDQGATAFLIHGGLPLSLASAGHFSFEIVPELNVGFGSSSYKAPGTPPAQADVDYSGFLFDIGARAGAEIHFGFMGIPQLSLQGSIGLLYQMQSVKVTQKAFQNNPEQSVKHSTWRFATTVNDYPWNIFTSNVAALYYF